MVPSLKEVHVGVDDLVVEPPIGGQNTEFRRGDFNVANGAKSFIGWGEVQCGCHGFFFCSG